MEDPTDDILLHALSPAEIALIVDQLEELDPDNELLPAGNFFLSFFDKLKKKSKKVFFTIFVCSRLSTPPVYVEYILYNVHYRC